MRSISVAGLRSLVVASAVVLGAGLVLAKGPTCDERQSREGQMLIHKQDECVKQLTKYGCDAGVCSLGLNECEAQLDQCVNTDLPACTTQLATAEACGNGSIASGESCDQGNLDGKTCATQGFVGGTLKCGANCAFDTSGCSTQRFTDNSNGTVTDHQTGLVWEQKSPGGTGDVHDVDTTYTWCNGTLTNCTNPSDPPDGTVFTTFLYGLNDGFSRDGGSTSGCFTGHCDWRLPTIEELAGIVDKTQGNCGNGMGACIDPTLQPTQSTGYWSATSYIYDVPAAAWTVNFYAPRVILSGKVGNSYARAVRGGL